MNRQFLPETVRKYGCGLADNITGGAGIVVLGLTAVTLGVAPARVLGPAS